MLNTVEGEMVVTESTTRPIRFAFEGVASADASALGLQVDKAVRLTPKDLLLAELRAAKGDESFGVLSGGLAHGGGVFNGNLGESSRPR